MKILLRCDGSPQLGVGHVVRAIALAEVAVAGRAGVHVEAAPFLERGR